MRIAFISANREQLPDAVIPLGILSVMAATPARHEKLFWDLCFEPDPLETVARRLRESQPDLVAIGLREYLGADFFSPSPRPEWTIRGGPMQCRCRRRSNSRS